MAVFSFAKTDADTVFVRNAIFRMILSRARARLTDSADLEELEVSEPMGAISFYRLDDDLRARMTEAVYEGTLDLKQDIVTGKPTEEPVRDGIEEKLDEVLALLARFRP
jgi:hypothetical protein